MNIGQRISTARKNRGLTQRQLSINSGVDYNTIIKIEGGGVNKPTSKNLVKIADALQITIGSLMPRHEVSSKPQVKGRQILPFHEKSFEEFERLVFSLIESSGSYCSVEHYAGRGDKQRDTIAIYVNRQGKPDDGYTYFQSKRYKEIDFGTLKTELDKIASHSFVGGNDTPFKPVGVTFCVAAPVKPTIRDKVKEHAKSLALPEPQFWGSVELNYKCQRHKDIIQEFFGGHITEAIEKLDQVSSKLNEHKENTEKALAKISGQIGVISKVDQAITGTDKETDIHLNRIKNQIEAKDFKNARDLLIPLKQRMEKEGVDKWHNELKKVYNFLGICATQYISDEGFEEARDFFLNALEIDPRFNSAKQNLAAAYMNLGKEDSKKKAYEIIKELIGESPDNMDYLAMYLMNLLSLEKKKELSDFIESRKNIEEIALGHPELLYGLATFISLNGDTEKALELSDKGLELFPNSYRFRAMKGKNLLMRVQMNQDVEDDTIVPIYNDVETIQEAAKLFEDAILMATEVKEFESFINLLKADLYICGVWLRKANQKKYKQIKKEIKFDSLPAERKKQLEILEIGKEMYERNFEAAYNKVIGGEIFLQAPYRDKLRLAEEFFSKAAPEYTLKILLPIKSEALENKDVRYWYVLSMTYALLGEKNNAISTVEEAKRIFKDNEKVYKQLLSHYGALLLRYANDGETDRLIPNLHELQEKSPEDAILTQVKAIEEDGTIADELKDFLDEARKKYLNIRDLFKENPYPAYFLLKFYGRSYPEILSFGHDNWDLEFTIPYTVCAPAFTDKIKANYDEVSEIIMDYGAWLNLSKAHHLGLLQSSSKKTVVHRLLLEQIQQDLLNLENPDLRNLWNYIRRESQIVEDNIKGGIMSDKEFSELVDDWLIQSIRYAKRAGILFVCDDLRLLNFVETEGVKISNTFAIFQNALHDGTIDKKQYALVLGVLAERFYTFIPFDGKDLFYIALNDADKIRSNQVAHFSYNNDTTKRISLRMHHLLNQINLAGSDYKSFFGASFQFLEEIWGTGLLLEDKVGYLKYILSFLADSLKDKLGTDNKGDLGNFFMIALTMVAKNTPKNDVVDTKNILSDYLLKNEYTREIVEKALKKFKDK